jgi:hypothetical protein
MNNQNFKIYQDRNNNLKNKKRFKIIQIKKKKKKKIL